MLKLLFFGINFSDPAGFRFNYPKNQLSFELQIHRKRSKDYILFQGNELRHNTDAAHNMLRDLKLADGLADLLTFFEHHFPDATSLADGKDGINELGSPWKHDPAILRVTKKH